MLCSQHHEIYNVISYHFKFNLKCPFRIPEFKTTSIVTWPCGHIKLLIIKPYSKMYSTIYMLLQENTNHLGSYIIMFIYQNKCSSSMINLHGTSGFRTSVIRFRTSCLQGFCHLFKTSGNNNTWW